ncbi:hypothetical protein [Endozoicomonas montiporae]|uniref:hypothetical protein n=1 Tax=Endozoicomonas montiporae TaxID=1027273 RepID=UPI000AC0DA37|nr:hypothetical protein [Endozoicomonas montiporae]
MSEENAVKVLLDRIVEECEGFGERRNREEVIKNLKASKEPVEKMQSVFNRFSAEKITQAIAGVQVGWISQLALAWKKYYLKQDRRGEQSRHFIRDNSEKYGLLGQLGRDDDPEIAINSIGSYLNENRNLIVIMNLSTGTSLMMLTPIVMDNMLVMVTVAHPLLGVYEVAGTEILSLLSDLVNMDKPADGETERKIIVVEKS